MNFLPYLEALRSRSYPFRTLQKELKSMCLLSAQGWDPLLAKYRDNPIENEDRSVLSETLQDIHDNHIRYGAKAITIFRVDMDEALRVVERLPELIDTASPFYSVFPLPLCSSDLVNTSFNPTPIWMEQNDNGTVRLINCAKRAFKAREPIELEDLGDEVPEAIRTTLGGYEQIYGIRCGLIQAYDSIVIRPNDERVEIHVDMCLPLTSDELRRALIHHSNILNAWVKNTFGMENWLSQPMNFFPLIQTLYNEPDGFVSNLGHATGTKSIKDEKMRNRRLDLREELFHKEGLRAVGATDAYLITKGWESLVIDSSASPRLTIPGHFSHVGGPNAIVDYVLIEGCSCQEDFEMVLAKLF